MRFFEKKKTSKIIQYIRTYFILKNCYYDYLWAHVYLRYLCLFVHSGVQEILCCIYSPSSCVPYPMLTVSLDCPFLIATSVFSNVYLEDFFDCHFGIL
jgi:hypothetical protein